MFLLHAINSAVDTIAECLRTDFNILGGKKILFHYDYRACVLKLRTRCCTLGVYFQL